jgi:hypothetical protein
MPSQCELCTYKVQREKLLETRELYGTRIASQLYGPFVMNFTNRR